MYRRNRIKKHAEYYIWWSPSLPLSIKVIFPVFIVYWSFKGELQLLLEGCKHIRAIIRFGYSTEGATCKMLMLLLKSQVESAFKKLDIRYIRYNLQCVIILMCIQLCVALHIAYLRFFSPFGISHLKWLLSRILKSAFKKIVFVN